MKLRTIQVGDDAIYQSIADHMAKRLALFAETGGKIRGGTFLDLGAHVGVFSLLVADDGAAKVIAVEPWREYYLALVDNVVMNYRWGRIAAIPAAVAATSEWRDIRSLGPGGMASLSYDPEKEFQTARTPCLTLRDLVVMAGGRVDFLKMDVEGAEWAALAAPDAVEAMSRVDFAFVEFHDFEKESQFYPPAEHPPKEEVMARLGFHENLCADDPLTFCGWRRGAKPNPR